MLCTVKNCVFCHLPIESVVGRVFRKKSWQSHREKKKLALQALYFTDSFSFNLPHKTKSNHMLTNKRNKIFSRKTVWIIMHFTKVNRQKNWFCWTTQMHCMQIKPILNVFEWCLWYRLNQIEPPKSKIHNIHDSS